VLVVLLSYNPAVFFFFLLIARCSLVKTITEKTLEHRGLQKKENPSKQCGKNSGRITKLKQSEPELEMSELFTVSNLSSCLLTNEEKLVVSSNSFKKPEQNKFPQGSLKCNI